MDKWMNEWMNEWMFNDIPGQNIITEWDWMFYDALAIKKI